MSLTERRLKYLAYAPCAYAPLSLVGSATILTVMVRTRMLRNDFTTYHRLLTGISVFDIILSTSILFGPSPIPKEARPFFVGAQGNTATCTAQGFLFQLGSASFCYSCMLMIYYVLVIRYNLRESFIVHWIEPFFHGIPIVFYGGTSILGIFWEVYNPGGTFCFIGSYPPGCHGNPELECERGEQWEEVFGYSFSTLPFGVWFLATLSAISVIAVTVLQRLRASRSYVFDGSDNNGHLEKKLWQVIWQCAGYAVWFSIFMVFALLDPLFFLLGRDYRSLNAQIWFLTFALSIFPIQGLFNCLIAIRPSFVAIRRAFPSLGQWAALKEAVWFPACATSDRKRRLSQTLVVLSGSRQRSSDIPENSMAITPETRHRPGSIEIPSNSMSFTPETTKPPTVRVSEQSVNLIGTSDKGEDMEQALSSPPA